MTEAHDEYQERLQAARLSSLVAETGVRVCELGMLLSAVECVAHGAQLLERGGVPPEELPGVPDPQELLYSEDAITTSEAIEVLARFLDMSGEGKVRLWAVLNLAAAFEDDN